MPDCAFIISAARCGELPLPGVPYEMKDMMSKTILPKIKEEFELPFIYHKTMSDFPKQYDPKSSEPIIQALWEEKRSFEPIE